MTCTNPLPRMHYTTLLCPEAAIYSSFISWHTRHGKLGIVLYANFLLVHSKLSRVGYQPNKPVPKHCLWDRGDINWQGGCFITLEKIFVDPKSTWVGIIDLRTKTLLCYWSNSKKSTTMMIFHGFSSLHYAFVAGPSSLVWDHRFNLFSWRNAMYISNNFCMIGTYIPCAIWSNCDVLERLWDLEPFAAVPAIILLVKDRKIFVIIFLN